MKKAIIFIIIIMMIFAIGLFIFVGNGKKNNNEIKNNENLENFENIENSVDENNNNEEENTVNEIENTDNTEKQENTTSKEASTEILQNEPATEEEKAIKIVKDDWKNTNNVSIEVQGMNEKGEYIVVVSDSRTTSALAFYNVNTSTGKFTKKEMN